MNGDENGIDKADDRCDDKQSERAGLRAKEPVVLGNVFVLSVDLDVC